MQVSTRLGMLPRWRAAIFGVKDEVETQLKEIAEQGSGPARIARTCGYLMLLIFSVGSALGVCASLIAEIAAKGISWQTAPLVVVLAVSVMLVICFDVASIYASSKVRHLAARRADWRLYLSHVAIIVVAALLESASFAYMSWLYDAPTLWVVAVLILGRSISAPIFSIYLNMAQPLPVGPADIFYRVELGLGGGLIRGAIKIANAPSAHDVDLAAWARSADMYQTVAPVTADQGARLDKLAAKFQNSATLQAGGVYPTGGGSPTGLPLPRPQLPPPGDDAYAIEWGDAPSSAAATIRANGGKSTKARKPAKPRNAPAYLRLTPPRYTKDELEAEVLALAERLGRLPSNGEIVTNTHIGSSSTASKYRNMLIKAGSSAQAPAEAAAVALAQ